MDAQAPYRLGPRVPVVKRQPTRVFGRNVASRVVARSSTSTSSTNCPKGDNSNLCEKPVGGNTQVLPIVLGVVIPVVAICCVLFYLHRRNVKKLRKEDMTDPHKSLDFGLAMESATAKPKRKSALFRGTGEKDTRSRRQLSMDMNLSSPYLLPPEVQNSRESFHSLARSLHQEDDPYRPVTEYTNSEVGSLRSFRRDGDRGSTYTGSNSSANGTLSIPGKRAPSTISSRSKSPGGRSPAPPPYPENAMPAMPPPAAKEPYIMQASIPVIETVGDEKIVVPKNGTLSPSVSELPVPPPVAKINRKGLPNSPRPQDPSSSAGQAISHNSVSEAGTVEEPFVYDTPGTAALRKDSSARSSAGGDSTSFPMPPRRNSRNSDSSNYPARQSSHGIGLATSSTTPVVAPIVEEPHDEQERGRPIHRRQSSEYPPDNNNNNNAAPEQDQTQATGLGLPEIDTRRLSVGFRPLPPDELLETEDPETRANRIRSFYREYFDDKKVEAEYNQNYPPMPANRMPGNNGNGGGQYYEDYDAAYIDPASNSFVMPYAQPVSRRAMTPPPAGSRFAGPRGPGRFAPRGPPHQFHGSMGAMSPRPGSSMSNQPWPRSASNMSGNYRNAPRKPAPPPMDLTTLPTPSKLKDDSFAIFNATDFAPPPTFRDQAAGRPQSPLGERKKYELTVPISSPMASSFDDMAALPSPHLLRKSLTFTNLDFAPPKRIRDNTDNMSDAGSIRSNRSGISVANQFAIRSGAGRISRLPNDTVFSKASQMDQLRPTWDARGPEYGGSSPFGTMRKDSQNMSSAPGTPNMGR